MLDFRDVPTFSTFAHIGKKAKHGPLPASFVGQSQANFGDAVKDIRQAWDGWFTYWDPTSAAEVLEVDLHDVALALSASTRVAMPYRSCLTYAELYMHTTDTHKHLGMQPFVANLPNYHRGAADQLLGVGLSLAVTISKDRVAFASKPDYEKLMAKVGVSWTRPWPGEDGPDFLTLDRNRQFAFLEIKGRANVCVRTPVNFSRYKAQSLNARLGNIPTRHVLSYAYFPAGTTGDHALVRWFNASSSDRPAPKEDPQRYQTDSDRVMLVELAVALCHFETILRNAGLRAPLPSERAFLNDEWSYDEGNGMWVEARRGREMTLVVPLATASVFRKIARLFEQLKDGGELSGAVRRTVRWTHELWRVLQLIPTRHLVRPVEHVVVLERYANGVCIVEKFSP